MRPFSSSSDRGRSWLHLNTLPVAQFYSVSVDRAEPYNIYGGTQDDAALRSAAPHLKHLHTCENDRGTPGTGHVAWSEFFTTIKSIGDDGWMTTESFGFALG